VEDHPSVEVAVEEAVHGVVVGAAVDRNAPRLDRLVPRPSAPDAISLEEVETLEGPNMEESDGAMFFY